MRAHLLRKRKRSVFRKLEGSDQVKLKSVVWGAVASARSDDTGVLQERSELFALKLVCT